MTSKTSAVRPLMMNPYGLVTDGFEVFSGTAIAVRSDHAIAYQNFTIEGNTFTDSGHHLITANVGTDDSTNHSASVSA